MLYRICIAFTNGILSTLFSILRLLIWYIFISSNAYWVLSIVSATFSRDIPSSNTFAKVYISSKKSTIFLSIDISLISHSSTFSRLRSDESSLETRDVAFLSLFRASFTTSVNFTFLAGPPRTESICFLIANNLRFLVIIFLSLLFSSACAKSFFTDYSDDPLHFDKFSAIFLFSLKISSDLFFLTLILRETGNDQNLSFSFIQKCVLRLDISRILLRTLAFSSSTFFSFWVLLRKKSLSFLRS